MFCIIGLVAAYAHHTLHALTADQQPRIWHDSHTFLEIAAQPFKLEHLFYPKPLVTPLIERLAKSPDSLIAGQVELAFWSWVALAAALGIALRRWRSRLVSLGVCFAFMLAPLRVGFTAVAASEPISDALQWLSVAALIALVELCKRDLRHRAVLRVVLSAALVLLVVAWTFTRDTNAIVALTAIAFVAARGFVKAWWAGERWVLVVVTALAVSAAVSMWSSQVVPQPPLGLSLTDGWAPESTARSSFALVDNFMIRLLADPRAKQQAIDAGLPWSHDLDRFIGSGASGDFLSADRYKPSRDWIYDHGAVVYVEWLVRHPISRLDEVIRETWALLTPADAGRDYMGKGWRGNSYGSALLRMVRALTESPLVVLLLGVSIPVFWRRASAHTLAPVVAGLAWSAVLGIFAAYYGDSMEMVRHAWGACQQLLFALFMIPLMWIDQTRRRDS